MSIGEKNEMNGSTSAAAPLGRRARVAAFSALGLGFVALGPILATLLPLGGAADAGAPSPVSPEPPADGVMGFVVSEFVQPIVPGTDACPDGPVLKLRDAYLQTLPPAEQVRLKQDGNKQELEKRWQSYAFGEGGTNICSQPDKFDHALLRTVQSTKAVGLDLDGDSTGAGSDSTCGHANFEGPQGGAGIDNQEYRALGCKLEWRGLDGMPSDNAIGMKQYYASGEWTQVILLKGVDSLLNDDDVEVIYGNTPDRPYVDSKGDFLPGATFTISDKPPRHRNVLRARIRNGVLETEPADIKLTQTWGQGGARDIRGNRTIWDYRMGRLRLTFQRDGSLQGLLAGYRPVFDLIASPAIGGFGSAVVAGIDCAAELKTIRHYADGLKDPKTGQCEGISSTQRIVAIPAFVNDVPASKPAVARN